MLGRVEKESGFLIFADGACTGNPGPGGWGAIVFHPDGLIEEFGGRAQQTTNNQMELLAVIRALAHLRGKRGPVEVISDSLYVLRGITQWIWGWRKRDWKTAEGGEVSNRDLWQALSAEVAHRRTAGDPAIRWSHVRGHKGIPGNERVDEIAVAFSQGKALSEPLYRGPLLKYFVAIHDLPESRDIPESDPNDRREKPPAALAYLSLVDGVAMRHPDWKSCEARVKGRSGAKFKKVISLEEEKKIWESWGIQTPPTPNE